MKSLHTARKRTGTRIKWGCMIRSSLGPNPDFTQCDDSIKIVFLSKSVHCSINFCVAFIPDVEFLINKKILFIATILQQICGRNV